MRRECPECNEFDGARLRVLLAELDDELTSEGFSEPCRIGFCGRRSRCGAGSRFRGGQPHRGGSEPEVFVGDETDRGARRWQRGCSS